MHLYLDGAALKCNLSDILSAAGSMRPETVLAVLVAVGTMFSNAYGSDSVVKWNQDTQCCRPPWATNRSVF